MMATDFLLNAHKPTDPSFQDIMQIKQNANRAASLVRQLLAFSRRQTLRPQVLDLGDVACRSQHAAAPVDRREGRARRRARPRPVAGEGRHLPVRAGDRQSRGQRARRHAGWRQAHGAHRQRHRRRNARAVCATRACRPPTMCWSRSPTPAPASRRRSSTRSSSRSSPPRRSARARASASRRCTASSSRPAASSIRNRRSARARLFRIFLPRHVPSAEEVADAMPRTEAPGIAGAQGDAEAPRRAAADLTGQGTILLVEDEEGLRALNARGLSSRGYTRARGRQRRRGDGGAGGRGGKVDLVVSDVVMPEMDGPTLLKELRKQQSRPQDDLRVGLRRGGVREEPAGRRASSHSCPSRSRSSSWSSR